MTIFTRKTKNFGKLGSYLSSYLFLAILGGALVVGGIWLTRTWFEATPPEIQLLPEVKLLGASQNFTLNVSDATSGLSRVRVWLRQGQQEKEIVNQTFPGRRWGRGGREQSAQLTLNLEPQAWGFQDGPADLRVEARDYSWWGWLQGNRGQLVRPVTIDLTPLRLSFISTNEFINQGGTGLVLYQVNKPMAKSGILVNGEFFAGFPIPGGAAGQYLAFFAVPYFLPQPLTLELLAVDQGGTEARSRVSYRLKPKKWRNDRINLSDAFLTTNMPEFQSFNPELKSLTDPLEVFLRINRDERQRNDALIREVCRQSQPERFWQGTFLRLPNSKSMAAFADQRTYFYQGREVDRQVHLGQDLASLERAEVPAANNGLVVFTGSIGIYGQSVILDHGLGIFTLYSHLSEISVAKGQKINRGAILGRTGTTGLAGGDHLHYSVMVQGAFVNPLEWWDPKWIKDQVERQLAGLGAVAAPVKPAASEAKPKKPRPKGRTPEKKTR
ncbi:MAG: M23 family metallopeptidase [Deltaproteobacteria bacterium]|nr:M23 family metallopeptidase [Deltaproteobacteria bacterium]